MYLKEMALLLAVNCLLAAGVYLPLSTGLIIMCFGSFMGVGAIVGGACYSILGMPTIVAMTLGGAAAAVFGGAVAWLCARSNGLSVALISLAIGEIAKSIVINVPTFGGALGFHVSARRLESTQASIACILAIALALVLDRPVLRSTASVIKHNDNVAQSIGVNAVMHKTFAILTGAFLAGMAGALYIEAVGIFAPELFGFNKSTEILIFPLVGGTWSVLGAIVGAAALTIIPEILRFSAAARMILYGLCLVIATVMRPEGMLGNLVHRIRQFRVSRIAS